MKNYIIDINSIQIIIYYNDGVAKIITGVYTDKATILSIDKTG